LVRVSEEAAETTASHSVVRAVYPKIVGRGIHMHPLAIILAILCGAELGGLTGFFLAIPAVAVLTVTYRHYREHLAAQALDAPA